MTFPAVLEALTLLDSATVTGYEIAEVLKVGGVEDIEVKRFTGERGEADFLTVTVPGRRSPTPVVTGRQGDERKLGNTEFLTHGRRGGLRGLVVRVLRRLEGRVGDLRTVGQEIT